MSRPINKYAVSSRPFIKGRDLQYRPFGTRSIACGLQYRSAFIGTRNKNFGESTTGT